VVQRLIPYPLLVGGHKADIRFYLIINVDNQLASRRVGPIFVRRASAPYSLRSLEAEITNTAYRMRLELAPDITLLGSTPGLSQSLRSEIIVHLDLLASSLIDAYFWSAADDLRVPNRVILLGVDALMAGVSKPRLYFLETNPFPTFFRGLPACDAAIDDMIEYEYLPMLVTVTGRRKSGHPGK
jgi:hypothetical protein